MSIAAAELATALEREWGLPDVRLTVHNGGMNSHTWWVDRGERRWVAKAVPATQRDGFVAGLRVAASLDAAGVASGAPVATRGGELAADVGGRLVALLEFVPGVGLSAATQEHRRLIGTTLGRVHTALAGVTDVGATGFDWMDPTAEYLDLRDWIRPAVSDALAAFRRLDPTSLTTGLLHLDPAPEAFRYDPVTREVGLIDWATAQVGPLMYDLASAVMYVGGPARAVGLITAYLEAGPLDHAEVERATATMLRYRWAVQAYYFAHRIAHEDLTGIADHAGNEKGLADARAALSRW